VLSVDFAKPSKRRADDHGGDSGMRHASGYGKPLPQTMSFR
jgi:hypothetical protein